MQIVALIAMILSTVFLTACGAGIFVWTICLVAILLSSIVFVHALINPSIRHHSILHRITNPKNLYFVFLLLLIITIIPLPFPLTAVSGTKRQEQNRLVVEATAEATELGALEKQPAAWFSTTRNRAGSMRACVLLILAFAAASCASILSQRQKIFYLRFLILLGSIVAALGYLGEYVFPQNFALWWYIPVPPALPGPMGGFTHANHFAGFIGVIGLISLAMIVDDAANRRVFSFLFSLCAFSIISFALIASLSRGAFVLYLLSLALMGLFLLFRVRLVVVIPSIAVLLIIVAAVLTIALKRDSVRERIATLRRPFATSSFESRSEAWLDSFDIWKRYPLIGIGPNAFRMIYPIHRTSTSRAARKFAENEYVQFFCEFGLIGTLLLFALFPTILKRIYAILRNQKEETVIADAVCGAILMAGLHSSFEFIMHLPLYALVVFSMVGLLFSRQQTDANSTQETAMNLFRRMPLPELTGLVVLLVFSTMTKPMKLLDSWGHLAGSKPPEAARAMVWAPTSQLAWRRFGIKIAENASANKETKQFGERCLTQAAEYDSNNAKLWLRLGKLRLELGDKPGARKAFANVKKIKSWMGTPDVPD